MFIFQEMFIIVPSVAVMLLTHSFIEVDKPQRRQLFTTRPVFLPTALLQLVKLRLSKDLSLN